MLIEQKPNMLYMYRFTEVNFRRNKVYYKNDVIL